MDSFLTERLWSATWRLRANKTEMAQSRSFGQNVRVGLRSLMNGIGAGSEETHNTDIFLSRK